MKVVAIVGMSGSGKSEVARQFHEAGFHLVRFGDITDDEVKKLGLELNEANERQARELLREQYGMAAYARLSRPRIDAELKDGHVVVDGLYSWEEYTFLRQVYSEDFVVVAVWSSPAVRYQRLGHRRVRPLTPSEAESRDRAEIENLDKGGPIAMADFTVVNESSLADLKKQIERVIDKLK